MWLNCDYFVNFLLLVTFLWTLWILGKHVRNFCALWPWIMFFFDGFYFLFPLSHDLHSNWSYQIILTYIKVLVSCLNELPKLFILDDMMHWIDLQLLYKVDIFNHLFFLHPRFRLQEILWRLQLFWSFLLVFSRIMHNHLLILEVFELYRYCWLLSQVVKLWLWVSIFWFILNPLFLNLFTFWRYLFRFGFFILLRFNNLFTFYLLNWINVISLEKCFKMMLHISESLFEFVVFINLVVIWVSGLRIILVILCPNVLFLCACLNHSIFFITVLFINQWS